MAARHRRCSASARPRCTSRLAGDDAGVRARARSPCCASDRSCRACGRRCARRSARCAATAAGCRRRRRTSWPTSCSTDGDVLLRAFDAPAHPQARRPTASGSTATCTSARRSGPATTSCSSTSRASPGDRSASARSSARPLNDVAGIVRSLDYAGRVALATSAERGRTRRGPRPSRSSSGGGRGPTAHDRRVLGHVPVDAARPAPGRRPPSCPSTPPTSRCCSTPTSS